MKDTKEEIMFPDFFKHKLKEVKSFLRIVKGKATGNDQERANGVDDALRNMKEEQKTYQTEKDNAYAGIDPDTKRYQEDPQEKVLRESGGQDISAI